MEELWYNALNDTCIFLTLSTAADIVTYRLTFFVLVCQSYKRYISTLFYFISLQFKRNILLFSRSVTVDMIFTCWFIFRLSVAGQPGKHSSVLLHSILLLIIIIISRQSRPVIIIWHVPKHLDVVRQTLKFESTDSSSTHTEVRQGWFLAIFSCRTGVRVELEYVNHAEITLWIHLFYNCAN